jgi:hypothetical protein
VELLIEPGIEADGFDCFQVAGARAEGKAVEGVENALVALHLSGFIGWAGG